MRNLSMSEHVTLTRQTSKQASSGRAAPSFSFEHIFYVLIKILINEWLHKNNGKTQPVPIETKVFDKFIRAIHERSFFSGALCFKYQFSSYCFVNLLKRSIEAPHFIRIDTLLDASRVESSRVLCTKWINYCYVSMCDVCHIAIGLNIHFLYFIPIFNLLFGLKRDLLLPLPPHTHKPIHCRSMHKSFIFHYSVFFEQNRMESVECFQPIDFHNTMNAKYG